jgi:hypothetical protein
MPTHHNETLLERYQREHRVYEGMKMSKALELAKEFAKHSVLSGGIVYGKPYLALEEELRRLSAINAELLAALERFASWADSQADAQSKGGHATFDLMALREERDSARAAIARATAQANTEVTGLGRKDRR